jgi:hypothetical protein
MTTIVTPPDFEIKRIAWEIRDLARREVSKTEILQEVERRDGNIHDQLRALEWIDPGHAVMFKPVQVREGGRATGGVKYEPAVHSTQSGSVVTALERGFRLTAPREEPEAFTPPVPPRVETYLAEPASDTGETEPQAESLDTAVKREKRPKPYKCEGVFLSGRVCGRSFMTKKKLAKHQIVHQYGGTK